MTPTLVALALIFGQLSLLAIGGPVAILPEMQRQVVDVQNWMTTSQFVAMFAMAQASPGPNMMVVTLIGWHVGGWAGAAVATLCVFGPSSLLAAMVFRAWDRFRTRPWRRVLQGALAPLTVGLSVSGAALVTQATAKGWLLAVIVAAAAAAMTHARLPPVVVLAAGGIVALLG